MTTATGTTAVQPREGRMARRAFAYWLTNYRRVWRGSLISGFLGPLFFLVAMGFGLGTLIDDGATGGLGTPGYVQFIAPGILAAQAMQTAVGESTFPVMGALKWQRQYHAMLAAPLGIADVVLGHVVFVTMRVAITSVAFAVVAVVLGAITSWWVLLAVPAAVLTGLAFTTPVFAFAARQDDDSGFNVLFRFIVMPMFLFSGTFFPVEQLPGVLEAVARVTPLWHGVELCRSLVTGTATALGSLGHVAYLTAWAAGGLWLAFASFRKRLVT
ncbi:ABC transporter permease [Jiangella mangrovi]|uniref:Transport permease protein n=1 Tax=Jiangella mangrovi TaxID=1524084 RepID=A0A7W9GTJ8_9ACTN|nr:ABC transporter permease [Jiangella mangrovi]MBB5789795.1 lipooligosaccharide transport system permease protein [Jiangella mangrovi]